jgi:type I restriction enzyme S subunit
MAGAGDVCYTFQTVKKLLVKIFTIFRILFRNSMQHANQGQKMPRGSKDDFKLSNTHPLPQQPGKSLAIQSEIVRILDKFTALTAELTAELTARKKQYNYYRDQLLSFEEGGWWKTLGDVSRKIIRRNTKNWVTEYYDGHSPG